MSAKRKYKPKAKAPKGNRYNVEIGDRVGYSAAFLRKAKTQGTATNSRRGLVIAIKGLGNGRGIAQVRWDDGLDSWPMLVVTTNLAKVGGLAFCDAGYQQR